MDVTFVDAQFGEAAFLEFGLHLQFRVVQHDLIDAAIPDFRPDDSVDVQPIRQDMGMGNGSLPVALIVGSVHVVGHGEYRPGDGLFAPPFGADLGYHPLPPRFPLANDPLDHLDRDQQRQYQAADNQQSCHNGVADPSHGVVYPAHTHPP